MRLIALGLVGAILASCVATPSIPALTPLPFAPFQLRGLEAVFRIAAPGDNKRLAYPWKGNIYVLDQGIEKRVPGTFDDLSILKWPKLGDYLYYTTVSNAQPSISISCPPRKLDTEQAPD